VTPFISRIVISIVLESLLLALVGGTIGEANDSSGEGEQVVQLGVFTRPLHRRLDAQLDAADRVVNPVDGLGLGASQVLLGLSQDLQEQFFLAGEIPVEDALTHPETLHDLGYRGGVVPLLGEAGGGEVHQLLASLTASLGQTAGHGSTR